MYTGEEDSNTLIWDIGSCSLRGGFAGEDAPRVFEPSYAGLLDQSPAPTRYFLGDEVHYRRNCMRVEPFFKADRSLNADLVRLAVQHSIQTRLFVHTNESPMLLSEPDLPDKALRTGLAEQFFEELQVPALYFASASVLAAFGLGRQSALVVQSGAFSTSVVPIFEGSVVPKSIFYCELGGETLTYLLMDLLGQRGVTVRPKYSISKEMEYKRDSEGALELLSKPTITAQDWPQTHPSYHLFTQLSLIRDLKESLLKVSDTPYSHESAYQTQAGGDYELPDGTVIELGAERFRVPEVLFAGPTALVDSGVPGFKGIQEMAYDAIQRTEPDIRKDLYCNVVFAGGNALLAGFPERVLKKLLDMALPTLKVKQVLPATPAERRFGTWQGGSVLASLTGLRGLWMTREEYREHGPCILTRKPRY